jgi:hypothetical protein
MSYQFLRVVGLVSIIAQPSVDWMSVFAKETNVEKIETATDRAVDKVKRTYRKADDKICEIVNGKMNCVSKKIKHSIQNTKERIETENNEALNKID